MNVDQVLNNVAMLAMLYGLVMLAWVTVRTSSSPRMVYFSFIWCLGAVGFGFPLLVLKETTFFGSI